VTPSITVKASANPTTATMEILTQFSPHDLAGGRGISHEKNTGGLPSS
jgi:hypothetical protein